MDEADWLGFENVKTIEGKGEDGHEELESYIFDIGEGRKE